MRDRLRSNSEHCSSAPKVGEQPLTLLMPIAPDVPTPIAQLMLHAIFCSSLQNSDGSFSRYHY